MRLIVDDRAWGGWYGGFVGSFRRRGWNIEHVDKLKNAIDDEPTMLAFHNMASCTDALARRSGKCLLGAYGHTARHFPFTCGYTAAEVEAEANLAHKVDVMFVALESYRIFMSDWLKMPVQLVGYPFEWGDTEVFRCPQVPGSGAIAQRLDVDNNPLIALDIMRRSNLDDCVFFTSATGALLPEVEAAARALGIRPIWAATHQQFLPALAMNEWLVSATFNESFGAVIMEAAALGLSVCAPRVPGLVDLFVPDSLYAPFDVMDAAQRINQGRSAVLQPEVRAFHRADRVVKHIEGLLTQ